MGTIINFSANFINCYTEYDVPVIGIGDDPEDPEHYIVISQFIDKNETIDDSIGLQGHFLENEISNVIDKLELRKESLLIYIRKDKVEKIGAYKINISLDITAEQFRLLIKYVQNIFTQSSVIVEITN